MKEFELLQVPEIIEGIRNRDKVIIARVITLLESVLPEHRAKAVKILHACLPFSGNSIRIGISGAPGVGKSTFIESLGKLILDQHKKIAVLAIDPSSKKSKGSILGDKTRMTDLSKNDNVFIRPTPAGIKLGGIASATRETIVVLEAAGYDIILVETVGVGQSETDVSGITDIFILLLIAGAGDELQGIKRGIMEMADIIAINKSDGDNVEHTKNTRADIIRAIHLFQPRDSGWQTTVDNISATQGTGIEMIWNKILEHNLIVRRNGYFMENRNQQNISWFYENLHAAMLQFLNKNENYRKLITEFENKIKNGLILPATAVEELINNINKSI